MLLFHYFLAFVGVSLIGLLVVAALFKKASALKVTNAVARHIAAAIRDGAMTFLREEYKVISIVVLIIAVIIFKFLGGWASLCFVIGALFSMITGFIGMRAATAAILMKIHRNGRVNGNELGKIC